METQEQILQAMQKVYEDHHMSVVLVMKHNLEDRLEVGTGFIIKSTEKFALVMTCQHAVEQSKRITIRLSGSSEQIEAQIQHSHKESDLAILLVNMPSKYPELIFREKSEDVSVGELIFLVAYYNPDGLEALCLDSDVHFGRICGPLFASSSNTELTEVVHSCPSKSGCSGGPLIYDGKAIGVQIQSRNQMEYARSTESVNKILKMWLNLSDTQVITTEEMIGMLVTSK